MTREEAAEVVLKGDAIKDCEGCDGTGFMTLRRDADRWVEDFTIDSEFRVVPCRQCNGKMVFVREDYVEACRMLDKALPPGWPAFIIRPL